MLEAVKVSDAFLETIGRKHGGDVEVLISWTWVYFVGPDAKERAESCRAEIGEFTRTGEVRMPWRPDQNWDAAFRFHCV